MKRQKPVQNRALRLIGRYDWYARADKMHSHLEILKLKSFMKHLTFKLYAFARNSKIRYIKRLGTVSLVENRRVPKPVHILD